MSMLSRIALADALPARLHPWVERKLADMVCNHGGRRARSRGQWRVPLPYVLMGMVVNFKRMVKRFSVQEAPAIPEPV